MRTLGPGLGSALGSALGAVAVAAPSGSSAPPGSAEEWVIPSTTAPFFVVPSDWAEIEIIVIGAGGGAYNSSAYPWAGGGGGLARKRRACTPGEQIPYSFGVATVCDGMTANNGGGPLGSGTGAPGGTASGGDVNFTGGGGAYKTATTSGGGGSAAGYDGDGADAVGQIGGACPSPVYAEHPGHGADGVSTTVPAVAGDDYGGGAAGGGSGAGAAAGGAGLVTFRKVL